MSMPKPSNVEQRTAQDEADDSLRPFARYAREELPQLREELDEVIENLGRIARGEPPLRRGARRASR